MHLSLRGQRWLLLLLLLILPALSTGCGGGGGGGGFTNPIIGPFPTPTPTPSPSGTPHLTSLQVSPAGRKLATGTVAAVTVSGVFSDGSIRLLTNAVTYSSSNTNQATVSNTAPTQGFVTAGSQTGTVTITATDPTTSITGSTTFTVTNATLVSITVGPTNPVLAQHTGVQLQAVGVFSDNTTQNLDDTATWSSDSLSVAVSNTPPTAGLATTSTGPGSAHVSAKVGNITGTITVTVTSATLQSITVVPANASEPVGTSGNFTASGQFSDNTSQDITAVATFSSSNSAVASALNGNPQQGFVTALSAGSTTISASLNGVTGSTPLTVTGATLIALQISAATFNVEPGSLPTLTVEGIYSDGTTQNLTTTAVYSTSNSALLTVAFTPGLQGLLETLSTPAQNTSVTVTATVGSVSTSAVFNVKATTMTSLGLSPTNPTIQVNRTVTLAAVGVFSDNTSANVNDDTVYTSSNPSVAIVTENPRGTVFGVAAGTATITATNEATGVSTTTVVTVTTGTLASLTVNPLKAEILPGGQQAFTAQATFSDNTTANIPVNWLSSNAAVAVAGNSGANHGRYFGVAAGTVTVTAVDPITKTTATATLVVDGAGVSQVQINPTLAQAAVGTTVQFAPTAVLSDNTVAADTVTWASTNTAVATVSNGVNKGLAFALSPGTTVISAIDAAHNVVGLATLTVTNATLSQLQLSPNLPVVGAGETLDMSAIGVFSDNTTQNLTGQAVFSSSSNATATVSNGPRGEVTGVANGLATITAAVPFSAQTASTVLNVQSVAAITINGTSPMPVGFTKAFAANGTSLLGTHDVTDAVTWTSSNPAVASVTNGENRGVVTAVGAGATTITATDPASGVSLGFSLQVNNVTLQSIAITGVPSPSVPLGTFPQLTATGTFSDNSTFNVTNEATWLSSSSTVALVSDINRGKITPILVGSATVTAVIGNVTSPGAAVTVSVATLSSITVAPATPSVHQDATVKLVATGNFSDGSQVNLSNQVLWSSATPAVAVVDNGAKGVVTAIANVGTSVVTALIGSGGSTVSGTATVTAIP